MLARSFRDAVRSVNRSPLLAAAIAATLALAIAGVVTVLTLISAVVVRPLPFPDSRHLYTVQSYAAEGDVEWLSVPTFERWAEGTTTVDSLAAVTIADFNVLGGEHAESILAALVSPAFFETLRVAPARGRAFAAHEHAPGTDRVVILSHSFWQRRFGGDAAIVGKTVRLAGPEYLESSDGPYTIVGIMPEDFWLFWNRSDVLVPLRGPASKMSDRNARLIERVFARLRPGASAGDARVELTRLNAALQRQFDRQAAPAAVLVRPVQEAHFADVRPVVWLVGIAGAIVMILAAVNVATLLLARGLSREREFAIRLALGARRLHLAIQGGFEGLVLALAGGIGGVLLGFAATGVVRSLIPRAHLARMPGEASAIAVDGTVLSAVAVVVLILASVLGVASVTAGFSRTVFEALRRGLSTEGLARMNLGSALVGAQLALSTALVLTSCVLLHDLTRLGATDLGIRADGLVSLWVNSSASRFPDARSRSMFFERILERTSSVPGVRTIGAVDLPFQLQWQTARVRTEHSADADDTRLPIAQRRAASENYFAVCGIPLLSGRTFARTDAARSQPVAVVSRRLAQRLWPGRDPLGRQIRLEDAPDREWLTVIGVVGDVRAAPHADPAPVVYRPLRQAPPPWIYLMARTSGDPLLSFEPLKRAIGQLDRDQPVEGPWLVSEYVRSSVAPLRFAALLAGGFTLLGALIAMTGVYGLTAFAVNRSTRDIAVRKALGATTARIVGLFVRRCAVVAAPAFVAGAGLFGWFIRALAVRIQGVRPAWDAEMSAIVAAFAAVVLVAAILPTRRAARIEPSAMLRSE